MSEAPRSTNAHRRVQISVDDRVIWIAKDVHRFLPLLHLFDLAREHLTVQNDAAIRAGEPLARAIENRALGLPRHKILRIDFIHAKFRVRMARVLRIFEWLPITDRYLIIRGTRLGGLRNEVDVDDVGVR